jgi:hypothetical protein
MIKQSAANAANPVFVGESVMLSQAQGAFDPETLTILKAVYDEVCALVPESQHTPETRTQLAARIINLATKGERDPVRLRTYALMEVTPHAKAG